MAGIYIHIPFCLKACHYCDFHFSTSLKLKEQMISSICKEIELNRNYLDSNLIETIYFGGGTPSILDLHEVEKILKSIHKNFIVSNDLECTLELNPNDLTKEKIIGFSSLGINRLSVGGQSFHDDQLKKLNRAHTAKQIESTIKLIQDQGINNINLDLIYGLPGLKNTSWENDLKKSIDLEVTHLSCYCLTIEKGTVFHKMVKKGDMIIDDDKKINSQFLIMREVLINNGFDHYEISNFCIPTYESKHNTSYWSGKKYLGIGPSAHSYNGKKRHWNIKNNFKYIDALKSGSPFYEEEILSRKNIINEYILTRIRTTKGVSLTKIALLTNQVEYNNIKKKLSQFVDQSLLYYKNDYFFLTQEGMILCDKITSDLFLM